MNWAARARIARDQRRGDPLLAVAQRVVLADEDRVAVGGDDRVVELAIGDGEARATVGERLLLAGDRLEQHRYQRRTVPGDAPDAVRFDQEPCLEHVLGLGHRDRPDERAAPRIQVEQLLGLELHERLADGVREMPSSRASSFWLQQDSTRVAAVEQPLLDVPIRPRGRRSRGAVSARLKVCAHGSIHLVGSWYARCVQV